MSSGGSDICIHFLSYSEGREAGREEGRKRRKGGVGWLWGVGSKKTSAR